MLVNLVEMLKRWSDHPENQKKWQRQPPHQEKQSCPVREKD